MEYLERMKSVLDGYLARLERENVPCFIPERQGVRKMIPRHTFHDYPEVFLQTEGKTVFSFPGGKVTLEAGHILIVPPEIPHGETVEKIDGAFSTMVITPASDYVQCHLSHDPGQGIPGILHYEVFEGGEHVDLRQLTDLMIEKSGLPGRYGETALRGLSMSFLSTVRVLLEGSVPGEKAPPLIRHVKNMVLARYYDSSLKVSQMAELFDCTPDYLSWLFHSETGMTLNRYINQLRLKKSADLLRNTDYRISEIAWICGYGSPAYFSRLFSKEFHLSPVEFRRSP